MLPFTLLFCCVVMVKILCILIYVCTYILKSPVYLFSSLVSEDEDNSHWCILLVCYVKAVVGPSYSWMVFRLKIFNTFRDKSLRREKCSLGGERIVSHKSNFNNNEGAIAYLYIIMINIIKSLFLNHMLCSFRGRLVRKLVLVWNQESG